MGRDADGLIQLDAKSFDRSIKMGSIYGVVVADSVKRLLEASGLSHVFFHPTALSKMTSKGITWVEWEKVGEEWWEMGSDGLMPPLAPSMELYDQRNRRIVAGGDVSGGVTPYEGFYSPVELHYTTESLKNMPPFDLARTFEQFNNPVLDIRPLIASKRFYDFCINNGLDVGWVPVRIDP